MYQALPPLFLLAGQKSYVRNMHAEEGGPGNEARHLHITNIESTPYQNILPTISPHCQMLVSFDVIALFTNILVSHLVMKDVKGKAVATFPSISRIENDIYMDDISTVVAGYQVTHSTTYCGCG